VESDASATLQSLPACLALVQHSRPPRTHSVQRSLACQVSSSTLAFPSSAPCVVVAASALPPQLADGCALSSQVGAVANSTMAAGITKAIYLSMTAADGGRREPRDGDRLGAPQRAGIVESRQQVGSSSVFSFACAADGSRVAAPCSEAANAHARASVSACCPSRVGRYHSRTHGPRRARQSLPLGTSEKCRPMHWNPSLQSSLAMY